MEDKKLIPDHIIKVIPIKKQELVRAFCCQAMRHAQKSCAGSFKNLFSTMAKKNMCLGRGRHTSFFF